jgi:hypothetical protein
MTVTVTVSAVMDAVVIGESFGMMALTLLVATDPGFAARASLAIARAASHAAAFTSVRVWSASMVWTAPSSSPNSMTNPRLLLTNPVPRSCCRFAKRFVKRC